MAHLMTLPQDVHFVFIIIIMTNSRRIPGPCIACMSWNLHVLYNCRLGSKLGKLMVQYSNKKTSGVPDGVIYKMQKKKLDADVSYFDRLKIVIAYLASRDRYTV